MSGLIRQAETLAIMINRLEGDSEKVIRRSLSNETKELLLPLAGRDNQVRIRLFQPNGELYADTRSLSQLSPKVEVFRLPKLTDNIKQFEEVKNLIKSFFSIFQFQIKYPLYKDYVNANANDYNEVLDALRGFNSHKIRQDKNGKLILSVAAPIGNERRVRGAIMLSMDGKIIPNGTSSSKNEPRVITHTPLAPQASKPEIKSYSRSLAVKPCVSTKVRKRKSSSYSETRRFSGYYRTNNTKSTRTA